VGRVGECARREATAMIFKKCERTDCQNPGVKLPQVWIWAEGDEAKRGEAVKVMIPARVCEDHARTLAVEDYLGEYGFQAIAFMLVNSGFAPPSRATIEIRYLAVQNTEMN
jgi:hypothetical protein